MFQSLSQQRPSGRQTMSTAVQEKMPDTEIGHTQVKLCRRSLNEFQKSCSNWKAIFKANLVNL